MATLYPDFNTILNFQQSPTEGELHLLKYLDENLDSSYEVYFQPFLNGDRPDLVIMRKNSGVLLIEVKDWDLDNYVNIKGDWFVVKDGSKHLKLSPFKQVNNYKENLYNLHVQSLLEKRIKNSKMFSIVNCALYFHKSTQIKLNDFLKDEKIENKKYILILTPDQLSNEAAFKRMLYQTYMNRDSQIFSDDLYNRFKRIFQPSYHTMEEGVQIKYSFEQNQLIKSKAGDKKIKGVAGSGKTIVLAQRAVNSHLRTKKKVLILCYNITLKNYIHDLISKVRDNFNWSNFYITNYHNFIGHFLNNMEISPKDLFIKELTNDSKYEKYSSINEFESLLVAIREDLSNEVISEIWEKAIYSNINYFSKLVINDSDKYDSILIDEVQDYDYKWLEIIKKYFLKSGGEYVLFGDEKQNIYKRELEEDKKIRTNISGKWDESLKKSYRLHKNIATIASDFQKVYMKFYSSETIEIVDQLSLFNENNLKIEYYEFKNDPLFISEFIYSYIKSNSINSNDVCILGSVTALLRNIDFELRKISNEKTTTTFETMEAFNLLFHQSYDYILDKNEEIRLTKNILDGNLQTAIEKVLHKIDIMENKELSDSGFDSSKTKNANINKFVNLITPRIHLEIEKIRKNKKFHFWMNSGLIKLSTVHSFKGWEIPHLFLLLDDLLDDYPKHELIFTALTRCRFNLVIISIGSEIYKNFFKNTIYKLDDILV